MTEEELENKALTDFKMNFCSTCEDKETCDISILNCSFYDTIYLDAYKDGYKQGQKENECFPQKKDGTIDTCEVMKENERLKKALQDVLDVLNNFV